MLKYSKTEPIDINTFITENIKLYREIDISYYMGIERTTFFKLKCKNDYNTLSVKQLVLLLEYMGYNVNISIEKMNDEELKKIESVRFEKKIERKEKEKAKKLEKVVEK